MKEATAHEVLLAVQRENEPQLIGCLASMAPGTDVRPALREALERQRENMVELLLPHVNRSCHEALALVCRRGRGRFVDALIEKTPRALHREDALCWAAEAGMVSTINALLGRGVNVNAQNGTPLRLAAGNGHTQAVRVLLREGAQSLFDHHGENPVSMAIRRGWTEVAGVFIQAGIPREKGSIALWTAIVHGRTGLIPDLFDARYPNDILNRLTRKMVTLIAEESSLSRRNPEALPPLLAGLETFGLLLDPAHQKILLDRVDAACLPRLHADFLAKTLPPPAPTRRPVRL